ncbi:uncharacterized protein LAJ45_08975 [Morchella importuna]|uniref:uncharacterized protein n=1 Tax=Morchella importuna TaxID=1174673 RepID=UPI001E8DED3A|nr:uncharacterized protein LAJ45_08975 [Morchella importuna]KAH8146896.1 hypothetical protein LAJ45_08975 [Morchella importuna]
MDTSMSQGGMYAPLRANIENWLSDDDIPWTGVVDDHINTPEPQRPPTSTNRIDAPVTNGKSRAAKRKFGLCERVDRIANTLDPNLSDHHDYHSTETVHGIPSSSAYIAKPTSEAGAAGGSTNAPDRDRRTQQGSGAKKRGKVIATNNQKRTRKIPPQGAGDDEEDEENDQGWRDPRGYPCTHYLAVAHKNDSDFQPGGDYHECSLQGSNRVGQHISRKHVVTCGCGVKHKDTQPAKLEHDQTCPNANPGPDQPQPNGKTDKQPRCRTWDDYFKMGLGSDPSMYLYADTYVRFCKAMPAITKAWSSFAERDEGVAELRQRFLESPEFKQFIAENEVMKKFSPKHPLYDHWDFGEIVWSISWFPRRPNTPTPTPAPASTVSVAAPDPPVTAYRDAEAERPLVQPSLADNPPPLPSIPEYSRPGTSSRNNAPVPFPPPAADRTWSSHQVSDSRQTSTSNHDYSVGWPHAPPGISNVNGLLSPPPRLEEPPPSTRDRYRHQQNPMPDPHNQTSNTRTYRQNSTNFASLDQRGQREASETSGGWQDDSPNQPATSSSNCTGYLPIQQLQKLHNGRLTHHFEHTLPLEKNHEEVPDTSQAYMDIRGDLLRQVGTWVSQSQYPAGGQPPTSSNTHHNAFHGIDSQTHEFNRSFAGQFPPGDADAQMIDIQVFTEESVRLWNEIKQLAGYSFPDYNLR